MKIQQYERDTYRQDWLAPYQQLFVLSLLSYLERKKDTMADEDYVIETTDAGASATIPMEAGQIKKGG